MRHAGYVEAEGEFETGEELRGATCGRFGVAFAVVGDFVHELGEDSAGDGDDGGEEDEGGGCFPRRVCGCVAGDG